MDAFLGLLWILQGGGQGRKKRYNIVVGIQGRWSCTEPYRPSVLVSPRSCFTTGMISGRRFSTWSGFLSASSRTTWQAPIWVHHFSWGIIRLKVFMILAVICWLANFTIAARVISAGWICLTRLHPFGFIEEERLWTLYQSGECKLVIGLAVTVVNLFLLLKSWWLETWSRIRYNMLVSWISRAQRLVMLSFLPSLTFETAGRPPTLHISFWCSSSWCASLNLLWPRRVVLHVQTHDIAD